MAASLHVLQVTQASALCFELCPPQPHYSMTTSLRQSYPHKAEALSICSSLLQQPPLPDLQPDSLEVCYFQGIISRPYRNSLTREGWADTMGSTESWGQRADLNGLWGNYGSVTVRNLEYTDTRGQGKTSLEMREAVEATTVRHFERNFFLPQNEFFTWQLC